ncbi:MAG: elongation factor P [Candidatus Moraniibacteriota bacterium]|nr:MAG: elongation factor P [Candidatus Moranbacteria bacterium]
MLNISDIKTGKKIILEGEPYAVIYNEHSKMGRAGAVMRTKLKNLTNGAVIEKTFQGSDKVEEADISKSKAQYLYPEGDQFYFMDNETYDQFAIEKNALGNAPDYLTEGLEVTMLNFNGNPINIEVPVKVTLEVTEAPPGLKGDTQSGGDKLVTVETGAKITTPLFVETGDKIIINTERGDYVGKSQA